MVSFRQLVYPLLLVTALFSQGTAHNTNIGVLARKINSGIMADASYNVSYLNLPIDDVTNGIYGNPYGTRLYISTPIYTVIETAQVLLDMYTMMTGPWYSALNSARSFGQESYDYRVYQVFVPVSATYSMTVTMRGGLSNQIRVYNNNVESWAQSENLLLDDGDYYYSVPLTRGQNFIVVAIDSTTNIWTSPGILRNINLTPSVPLTWVDAVVLAENRPLLKNALPTIGSIALISVTKPTAIVVDQVYPINFGTGTVTYSNLRAGEEAYISPLGVPDYKIQQIYDGGGHVWEPTMGTLSKSFDGTTDRKSVV